MGKRKLTLLAQALVLVDILGADEQQTLADYLRGKLPQTPRRSKSTSAPSAGKRLPRKPLPESIAVNTGNPMGNATAAGASGD